MFHDSLTLIREKNTKRGTVTERVLREKIQSAALHHFVYVSMLWNFFPESALGDGPKIGIYFWVAYFPSYWHMPFKISDLTSYVFGFYSKNSPISVGKQNTVRVTLHNLFQELGIEISADYGP